LCWCHLAKEIAHRSSRSHVQTTDDISVSKLAGQIAGLVESLGICPATLHGAPSDPGGTVSDIEKLIAEEATWADECHDVDCIFERHVDFGASVEEIGRQLLANYGALVKDIVSYRRAVNG
jgi:hypothetical protein